MSDPKNPWTHAASSSRSYITPEDIMTAADAGADRRALMACVLDAIHRKEAEDYRLCAFVALHEEPETYAPARRIETAKGEGGSDG